ncbi:zinc ABC transporter substrate-binding protein [Haematobacter massiliensis]|uniref:High-affinity zinc uptake system protein ZnuA n=1 Tax=Haematobacter massiliensis TaxID=195105 RepID=A0A086Y0Q6_9RHOB|nr:zinc ABC transporter substrate-binding protein [Haematobacter massiliensis]KFI27856.1 zinc ABC transporter substrate-binding protein [Haematobacter massiliensis]OWJ70382.1 zinc ABC transporter substrate-binding protein [Haematobacter massiliensis]OWJ86756.1 zinc ABC transporter substrate-binding protein [Haematobacter massiliensis]QBJ25159.1 zinc ABC transporter substrate-binding protein [Haematobacter massiliensis]
MRYLLPLLTALAAPAAAAPTVVTDIPPVHSLAAQVMAGVAEPVLLLDRGADAHDFQLRPSQARALGSADLVVWIGPEMSPWMERGIGKTPALALLHTPGTEVRNFGEKDHADDHDHGHDHGDGHDHGHEGHDHDDEGDNADHADDGHAGHHHEGLDPHAWLDPANAAHWLEAIAVELSRLDPEHAAIYARNAAAAQERVSMLDTRLKAELAQVKDRPIVLFHDAYGYFAAHYGLQILATVSDGEAATPGAQRLSALRGEIADAACIFPEANHDPAYLRLLTEGTTVKIGGALDPEGSRLEPGAALYATLMTGLADTVSACLK